MMSVKIALSETLELPWWFEVSWSCLVQKAFNGLVAEARARGAYVRYILPYDAETGCYAAYKLREEREGESSKLPQYFADALRRKAKSWPPSRIGTADASGGLSCRAMRGK